MKKNSLTIDESVCNKHKLSLDEVLMLLLYRSSKNVKETYQNLLNREALVVKGGKALITQHWDEELDVILADSSQAPDEERLKALAKQMQELYPQGRIIDKRTGKPSSYYFRCNVSEIVNKLKTFFKRYGEFTDEQILEATKKYVASWGGNYQQAGFRLIKYFIFKDDIKPGPNGDYVEPISPLLDFLTNKDEDLPDHNEDWTARVV